MSLRAYGLGPRAKKMQKSNQLQLLEQRQHLLLNYFKTLSACLGRNQTRASRTIDWHLTNYANQVVAGFLR